MPVGLSSGTFLTNVLKYLACLRVHVGVFGEGKGGWGGECVFDDCILFHSGLSNATKFSVRMNKVLLCCVTLISSSQHMGGKRVGETDSSYLMFV